MNEFFEHKLELDPKHFRKLIQGKSNIVKFEKIGSGLLIHLGPANHKKIMLGYSKKRNKVLKLNKDEIEHNLSENMTEGSGFFKTMNKLGLSKRQIMGSVRTIAKTAAPLIKEAIPTISAPIGMALAAAAGNPEIAPFTTLAANKALNMGVDRMEEYGKTGKGMTYPVSEFYPKNIGAGLESDIKKGFNKTFNQTMNKIKGGGVNVHPVIYDDGFKPTINHFSRVVGGSGMQSKEIDPHSIYSNGYMNKKIDMGHQIYTPYVKIGGSFLPSGY